MDKLKMHSLNKVDENITKIGKLFPSCLTERKNEKDEVEFAIDFDVLRQELSSIVVEGNEERYQFTWPDKRQSVLLANAPIAKTLRPCREESVNFDTTENLYIEGDNLDVLKLLQETYLGKVKMIYIDPPYNTGNDFVYEDNFAQSTHEYLANSGQYDDEGNRLVQNNESNGRFHTDWLNMIYPRLKLAKDLLSDDGVIFISIDDNEVENLKKTCNEVLGENNCLGIVTWAKKRKGSFLSKGIISLTEYLLVYSKNKSLNAGLYGGKADENESQPIIKRTNNISELIIPANVVHSKLNDGIYYKGVYGDDINPVELLNDVEIKEGFIVTDFKIKAPFIWSQKMFDEQLSKGARYIINTLNFQIRVYKIYDDSSFKGFGSLINGVEIKGTNEDAYEELERIFNIKKLFDYSKPVNYIKELIRATTHFDKSSIILDFFSGSATTAHAVMQLNAKDGGNRKFIMVQLPEVTDEKSEAYKAGYKNICEIGKERIRRAGKKILEHANKKTLGIDVGQTSIGWAVVDGNNKIDSMGCKINEDGRSDSISIDLEAKPLDIGFRVLKLDSTNMKDVYYDPKLYTPELFGSLADNIKDDRTPEDLLFQVMLDLGVLPSSKIKESAIDGKKVFSVEDNYLIACFDSNVTESTVTAIAKQKPYYFVMRDRSMANDSVATNFEQIFATYSPETIRKVL